jgi:rhodanese-related sulfurtransferase
MVPPYQFIKPQEIFSASLKNPIILDVRTDIEHAGKHMACQHIHIPLDDLNAESLKSQRQISPHQEILILCRSGQRAAIAAAKLIQGGFQSVHVIDGGILACEGCGQSLEGFEVKNHASNTLPKLPLSLERQVRIAAGLLIVVTSLLGYFIHPNLVLLSTLIGGGLIFAGVTDKCGMALILAKAPWNKVYTT